MGEAEAELAPKRNLPMDGTENDDIYWDEERDSLEDTGNVEIKENTSDIYSNEEFLTSYDE